MTGTLLSIIEQSGLSGMSSSHCSTSASGQQTKRPNVRVKFLCGGGNEPLCMATSIFMHFYGL